MIRHISKNSIRHYVNDSGFYIPTAVSLACPFCKSKVTFSLNWNTPRALVGCCSTPCPDCRKGPLFIYVAEENTNTGSTRKYNCELFVKPDHDSRKPLDGIDFVENLPEVIKSEYHSAINVLNTQEYNAAAVICGRTLEGIVKSILPQTHHNSILASQLNELPRHFNFEEPILLLVHALRKKKFGGTL